MIQFKAIYYDGVSSRQYEVFIHVYPEGHLSLQGLSEPREFSLADLKVSPRLGNTVRSIYFPDGAKCETHDNDAVDELLNRYRGENHQGWIHLLESKMRYVLIALLLTALSSWAGFTYGIPVLSKYAAFAIPPQADKYLGQGTLETFDKGLLKPSQLPEDVRRRLSESFVGMVKNLPEGREYQLVFRESKAVGANAFALPSGIIVITDELVDMAESDNEIIAVFAHEIGHIVNRHAMRFTLQNSTIPLLISVLVGDAASITTLAATIPTLLIHAKYSREFEVEADNYAYDYLTSHKLPLEDYASILRRITESAGDGTSMLDYFSSHPVTEERVKRFTAKHHL